jgi:hypothetical protein
MSFAKERCHATTLLFLLLNLSLKFCIRNFRSNAQVSPVPYNWVRITTREPKFPECQKSGTQGRKALGEERLSRVPQNPRHSGKAFFPECNTWGRGAPTKGNSHLTVSLDGSVCQKNEKCLPHVPCSSTWGRWPLPRVPCAGTRGRSLFSECLFLALREGSLPLVSLGSTRGNIFIF